MHPNKLIKKEVRSRLAGNWSSAVALTALALMLPMLAILLFDIFISFLPFFLMPTIGLLLIFFLWFCFRPLLLGITRCFLMMAKYDLSGGNPDYIKKSFTFPSLSEAFYYCCSYSRKKKAFSYSFAYLLPYFLYFLPAALCLSVGYALCDPAQEGKILLEQLSGTALAGYIVLSAGTFFMGFAGVLAFFRSVRLFFADYLFVAEEYGGKECLSFSSQYGNRYRMEIISHYFHTFFWYFLCVLAFPILYVFPFLKGCRTVCAKWLLKLQQPTAEQNTDETASAGAVPECQNSSEEENPDE